MKTIRFILLAALVAASIGLGFTGCSSDKDDEAPETENRYVFEGTDLTLSDWYGEYREYVEGYPDLYAYVIVNSEGWVYGSSDGGQSGEMTGIWGWENEGWSIGSPQSRVVRSISLTCFPLIWAADYSYASEGGFFALDADGRMYYGQITAGYEFLYIKQ